MENLTLQKMRLSLFALTISFSFFNQSAKSQTKIDDYLTGTPTLTIKGNAATNLVSAPADLEFNPTKPTELWVLTHSNSNNGSDMVIFTNAGQTSQTSKLKKDYNAYHFMCNAAGFAFGDNGNFRNVHGPSLIIEFVLRRNADGQILGPGPICAEFVSVL